MTTHSLPSFTSDVENWIIDKIAAGYSNRRIAESLLESRPHLLPDDMTEQRFCELVMNRLRSTKNRGIWNDQIEERRLKIIRRPITLDDVRFIECANREERLLIIQDQIDALRNTKPSEEFKAKDIYAEIRAYLTLAHKELEAIQEEQVAQLTPAAQKDQKPRYAGLLGNSKGNGGSGGIANSKMAQMDQAEREKVRTISSKAIRLPLLMKGCHDEQSQTA